VQPGRGQRGLHRGHLHHTYYQNCRGPYEKGKEDPNLEPDDSPCFRFGDTHGGTAAPNLVTGCDVFFDAVGDLDWDGTPYYPDWTQARVGGLCVWEFGNMRNGNTFGGDAQYGAVGPGTLGAFAGPIRRNPNC
jgi:hypothetical protein